MSNNQLPADVRERIYEDAWAAYKETLKNSSPNYSYGYRQGYKDGATAEAKMAQLEIDRRNKLLEDDLKRQCRLNMPGISEQQQEVVWQAFKASHNL